MLYKSFFLLIMEIVPLDIRCDCVSFNFNINFKWWLVSKACTQNMCQRFQASWHDISTDSVSWFEISFRSRLAHRNRVAVYWIVKGRHLFISTNALRCDYLMSSQIFRLHMLKAFISLQSPGSNVIDSSASLIIENVKLKVTANHFWH